MAPAAVAPAAVALAAGAPGEQALLRLRLHCQGVVQGVGFRPTVARLAASLGLSGSALNVAGAVRLELWGEHQALATFVEQLPRQLPDVARLDPLQPLWSPAQGPAPPGLRLGCASARSLQGSLVATALVADRAPCAACLAELSDRSDRRYRFPFISCCRCGPRYSIATQEPFSRAGTTLAGFPLCAVCEAEFHDPANRRFHAETIGCWQCGPRLRLLAADGTPLLDALPVAPSFNPASCSHAPEPANGADPAPFADPLREAVALLRQGAILALQGVGGFQLLALAQHATAVAALRERKQRPHKPWALLVFDPSRLRALLQPSQAELQALRDPAAPIVLLPCPARVHAALLPGVAPGAPALGVMLPASPLHWLLAREVGEPLVATSGNRRGEPLCLDPDEAVQRLAGIADAFLVHNRPITRRLDDSVLQVVDGRPALLRRSRGYAPQPLELPEAGAAAARRPESEPSFAAGPLADQAPGGEAASPDHPAAAERSAACQDDLARDDGRSRGDLLPMGHGMAPGQPALAALLALGGDLKAAPALALRDRVWPAPHLGDLEDRRCQRLLEQGLDGLAARWGDELAALLGDGHPESLGRQLAARWPRKVPWIGVQHHLAHALSVVAEQRLELPLLALCADGLGYGAPELGHQPRLWGCELLWITASGAERLASLRPMPLAGGDQAQREPRRLALGLLAQLGAEGLHHPGAKATLEAFAPAERRLLLQALAANLNCPFSSSLGRLFDAVASILDLCQVLSHEGQSGLLLQGLACDGQPTVARNVVESARNVVEPSPKSDAKEPTADAPTIGQPVTAPTDPRRFAAANPGDGMSQEGLTPYPLPLRPAPGLPLGWLDWEPLLRDLLADRAEGQPPAASAARFHLGLSRGLAELLLHAAGPRGCHQVVLAGGCFQNALLLRQLLEQLRAAGLRPHWGQQLPCNDGGLALGQIWAARLGVSITPAEGSRVDV
ncbi:MAG: Sua5/YciO/YrdC/YwlC family protein [Synechococcaceae cyanobacterium]